MSTSHHLPSLVTPKVRSNSGNSIASQRLQDPSSMICPTGPNHDIHGRPACPQTLNTMTSGCGNTAQILEHEDARRPHYDLHIKNPPTGVGAGGSKHPHVQPHSQVIVRSVGHTVPLSNHIPANRTSPVGGSLSYGSVDYTQSALGSTTPIPTAAHNSSQLHYSTSGSGYAYAHSY